MNEPEAGASSAPSIAPLQFDRAVRVGTDSPPARGAICTQCRSPIPDQYFTLSGTPVCVRCKDAIQGEFDKANTPAAFGRALAFGLGAAIAGAVIYFAVIALLKLEIGIVAILIGYMVGRAIQKALGGAARGGRRYQILAAVLTYWAVGLAYVPMAMQPRLDKPPATADSLSGKPAAVDTARQDNAERVKARVDNGPSMSIGRLAAFVGMALLVSFALPVIMVAGTMPTGVLSGIIILVGVRQAWRMTAGVNRTFVGPLRVASPPPQPDTAPA